MKVYSVVFRFKQGKDWNNHAKCLVLNTFSTEEVARKNARMMSLEAGETGLMIYEQNVLESSPSELTTDLQDNYGKYLATYKNGELVRA